MVRDKILSFFSETNSASACEKNLAISVGEKDPKKLKCDSNPFSFIRLNAVSLYRPSPKTITLTGSSLILLIASIIVLKLCASPIFTAKTILKNPFWRTLDIICPVSMAYRNLELC
ncbi:hypothetical protein N9C07_04125 [Flavobacteriaceae bacterium]|nr:hypothetical protein [Flavobacteriaceae bacterium]MDB9873030.1 hypothetical protein [Flavobacteriaceae bacterium]MDC1543408.1 hypothetical protein [Flavobacteriaceae bacterium]